MAVANPVEAAVGCVEDPPPVLGDTVVSSVIVDPVAGNFLLSDIDLAANTVFELWKSYALVTVEIEVSPPEVELWKEVFDQTGNSVET